MHADVAAAGGRGAGRAALVATGCGTAIACVCAAGLAEVQRRLGGLWSLAAVGVAALLCAALARALGRLAAVVPSGVGLLAFLSRGLGRRAALALVIPYVLLVLAVVALEARIVGAVAARLLPLPPLAGTLGFLAATWAVARLGLRPGLRAQALATYGLLAALALLSLAALARAGADPTFAARLLPTAPPPLAFVAGVGQALFLFMGFELVTTQVEVARTPGAVGWSLSASVRVLAAFYALMALGLVALGAGGGSPGAVDGDWLSTRLAGLPAPRGVPGATALGLLCLLASFTSMNGVLLTLSRLVYALASQGLLPRALARMDGRRLVPPAALAALVGACGLATVALEDAALARLVLGAAAAAAALVWAAALYARERPPFAERGRSPGRRALGLALGGLFLAFGAGALTGTLAGGDGAAAGGAVAHAR